MMQVLQVTSSGKVKAWNQARCSLPLVSTLLANADQRNFIRIDSSFWNSIEILGKPRGRAFVVVDKGEDPENQIIDVGVFRVFKDEDGLAAKTNWEDYELMEARGMKAPVVKIGEKSK